MAERKRPPICDRCQGSGTLPPARRGSQSGKELELITAGPREPVKPKHARRPCPDCEGKGRMQQ